MTDLFDINVTALDEQLPGVTFMDLGRTQWEETEKASGKELIFALNLLVTRIFYDFCRDDYWCAKVQNKIQNKLATIHVSFYLLNIIKSYF